ncbi:MAG: hypothetical protein ACYTAN_11155 [Planctomycetota bacterium]
MKVARNTGALALVIAASAFVNMYIYVSFPVRSWDETFHIKSSLHDVNEFSTDKGYAYATDHPTLKRLLYRYVLHAAGTTVLHTPDVDYSMGQDWNVEHGHLPPFWTIVPLRVTNALLVTAATVMIFFAALLILRNGWYAALVVAPLILSQRIAAGVVGYVGCDALLEFFLALTLLLMVALARSGKATNILGIAVLGAVSGLAASTKLNGALAVIAVMVYLAVATKGLDRLFKPLAAGAVASLVFAALNPVVRGGGLGLTFGVIWDMLGRRRYIWQAQYAQFGLTRAQLLARFFPYAAFLPPLVAAVMITRKEKWCRPLVVWGATLALGTLFSVNRTYDRYFMPVELGTFAAGGILAWAVFRRFRGTPSKARKVTGKLAATLAAAGVALCLMTAVLAARAPWGPSRLRLGFPAAAKVRLFFRQAVAYYGLAEPLEQKDAVAAVKPGEWAPPGGEVKSPQPLFTTLTRRMIGYVFYVAGLVIIFFVGVRTLGSRALGLLLLVPFLWADFADGDFWIHAASDCYLVFFTALFLHFAVSGTLGGKGLSLRYLLLAAASAGVAVAVAPRAAALVCAATALAVLRSTGAGRVGRALLVLAVSAASYVVLEAGLWYLGCGDTLSFIHGIFRGASSHWYARFKTIDPLIPMRDCTPWWPLVPLMAAVLFAARREKWTAPVALYGSFVAAAVIIGLPASAGRVRVDVPLAFSIACGLPALSVLSRLVKLRVNLNEPESLADYAAPGAPQSQ